NFKQEEHPKRDLVQVFAEAYAKSRNPHGTGMSRGDDDYFDGDDPDKGDQWADDDLPDESPEEEREMAHDKQRRLDAALRQARLDEMEDGEDEQESEDEEEDDALGRGQMGVRDSRRGAKPQA